MTFGQKRHALRTFRKHVKAISALVNSYGFRDMPDGLAVTLPPREWDLVQFGLSHVKTWLPELDDEQEVIPGRGKFVRINSTFCRPRIKAQHILIKNIPVLCGDA